MFKENFTEKKSSNEQQVNFSACVHLDWSMEHMDMDRGMDVTCGSGKEKNEMGKEKKEEGDENKIEEEERKRRSLILGEKHLQFRQ